MSYTVQNYLRDGTGYDITPLVKAIRWSGDTKQTARKLEVDLAFGRDYYLPKYDVALGTILMLFSDGNELFRGVVFERERNTDGTYKVTAYEKSIYLLKDTATYKFTNMTADAITRRLCADFGVTAGDLPAPGIPLSLILRNQTVYDMILIAWTETSKRNGKKYQLKMSQGKFTVIEKGAQTVRWLLAEGQNLNSADFTESITDMRNQVVVMGDNDQVLAVLQDTALRQQYGLLQELKQDSTVKSAAEARIVAQNALKELAKVSQEGNLTCLGIDDVVAGTAIEVKDTLTHLVGTFYVDTDDHEIQDGQHTMTLKLSWTDDVETKEAPTDNG